ncbi:MAG: hypothetical protein ACFFB0_10815 [Promethearchaeota archaeon]
MLELKELAEDREAAELKEAQELVRFELLELNYYKKQKKQARLEKRNLELLDLYAKHNLRYLEEKQNYLRNLEAIRENYRNY